ncbi:hypothetical protein BLL52_3213 [Rhodoferax antarcticus ANT.BR]|uniref:Uncharacterized protein n=1 Tax=Rhodoferax antarcticus ANT.BR TaxID=1111071 RepID=A0A1Q8YC32_9BURK|nr:hypothetical protein BLL52_3213 [Rhodoferax antarcticus ANT.BR]
MEPGKGCTQPLPLPELQTHAIESGDVGCVATSAKRHSAGNAPGMTAMAEVIATLAR